MATTEQVAEPSDIATAMKYILDRDGSPYRMVESAGLHYLYHDELAGVVDFMTDEQDEDAEELIGVLRPMLEHALPNPDNTLYVESRYSEQDAPEPTDVDRIAEARELADHFGCKVLCSMTMYGDCPTVVAEPNTDAVRHFVPVHNPRWLEQEVFRLVKVPRGVLAGHIDGDAAHFRCKSDQEADQWLRSRKGGVNLSIADRLRGKVGMLKLVPGTTVPRARFEREAEFMATPTQARPKPLVSYLDDSGTRVAVCSA